MFTQYRYTTTCANPGNQTHLGWGGYFEEVYVKENELVIAVFFGPGARYEANQLIRKKVLEAQLDDENQRELHETKLERRVEQQPMWWMGHELISEKRLTHD